MSKQAAHWPIWVACVGLACNARPARDAPLATPRPDAAQGGGAHSVAIPLASATATRTASEVAAPASAESALPAFIACEKSLADWSEFGQSYATPGNIERWGWSEVDAGGGLLTVFQLSEPVSVFGERTSRIAFSGSGVVALLRSDSWERLVATLRVEPSWIGATSKIFSRDISSSREQVGDQIVVKKISLSLSKSAAYPDAVLAGCSYVIELR